jgi:hypothetical protein
MALTQAQYTILRADIIANFAGVPMTTDGDFEIAAAYNFPASPVFRVWRTNISTSEVKRNFVWTELIARSAGERDSFQLMLSEGVINGADPNIRQGIADVFSQPAGLTSRTQLLAMAKRNATRAEKLFATGTGSDAVPATMTFEGNLGYQDVSVARAL